MEPGEHYQSNSDSQSDPTWAEVFSLGDQTHQEYGSISQHASKPNNNPQRKPQSPPALSARFSTSPTWLAKQIDNRPAALNLQAIVSHQVLAPLPNEQACYALLHIMPAANFHMPRMPLNLCLVIDRSTSMRGERLQQVKQAIHHIIDSLTPEDALSLIAFSDRAEILLPGKNRFEPNIAKSAANTLVSGGGTQISPALLTGLEQLKYNQSRQSVNHLILLTDGQTYGDEQACLEQAQLAETKDIHFSTIGLGTDWNENLLDQMACLSGGNSIYIDSPEKIKGIFDQTIRNLETIVARRLTMRLNLDPNIYLYEAHQLMPHICKLDIKNNQAVIGCLSAKRQRVILMEFRVQKLTPDEQTSIHIKIDGDIPVQTEHRAWEQIDLTIAAGPASSMDTEIPTSIVTTVKNLIVFKMQKRVEADLKQGQIGQATQRLKIMATRLFELGNVDLARTALREAGRLDHSHTISAEGRKKMRYATRELSASPIEMPSSA